MQIEDLLTRLDNINSEIESRKEARAWIREEHYRPWLERYNAIIHQLNTALKRNFPSKGIASTDYSSSGKTITNAAIESFQRDLHNLRRLITENQKKAEADANRFHCFKIGVKCPHHIQKNRYKFFVGMPFADKYKDSYEFGIKTMLNANGIDCDKKVFKADEKFDRVDVMCKICKAIQESEYVIINITDQNPNVMFELGLAYGLNKHVFLIKDSTTPVVSDLKGLEYIEYAHALELSNKLRARLNELGVV